MNTKRRRHLVMDLLSMLVMRVTPPVDIRQIMLAAEERRQRELNDSR